MQRLHNHRRYRVGVRRDNLRRGLHVIEGRNEYVIPYRALNTRRGGLWLREVSQMLRKEAGHAYVVSPVVGSLELDHTRAPREGTGKAHRIHGGFRAGGTESQPVACAANADDLLGQSQ